MDSSYADIPSVCRVSTFGHPRVEACLRLTVAFRSLPRPSSALGARASALCSCSLDFFLDPETIWQSLSACTHFRLSPSARTSLTLVSATGLQYLTLRSVSLSRPLCAVVKVLAGSLRPQVSLLNPENDTVEKRDSVLSLAFTCLGHCCPFCPCGLPWF